MDEIYCLKIRIPPTPTPTMVLLKDLTTIVVTCVFPNDYNSHMHCLGPAGRLRVPTCVQEVFVREVQKPSLPYFFHIVFIFLYIFVSQKDTSSLINCKLTSFS